MITKLEELISIDFWSGVVFGRLMNTIVNMGSLKHPRRSSRN